MKLDPSEFDISYFDGLKARAQGLPEHSAGYSRYERKYPWYESVWTSWVKAIKVEQYVGKRVLDIGCAKGFYVQELRKLGVLAKGLDISPYAINESPEEVKPYLRTADARFDLAGYEDNEFDLVYSVGFLDCLEETELMSVIPQLNRISKYQYHCVFSNANPEWYLIKTLSQWAKQGFQKGKTLLKIASRDEELKI